jgi:hypothetical protein
MRLKIEQIAEIAHEVNKAYCQACGDFSQVSWNNAPEWQKNSAIEGVKLAMNNTNISPEKLHAAWVHYKISNGWKYGLDKDEKEKKHPCLLPYAELPAEQRAKDSIFQAIVLSLKNLDYEEK